MTRPDGRPDYARLADWLDGRLDDGESARVRAEVDGGDDRVRDAAAWLRQMRTAARVVPLHDPPPIVGQRLRQHFERWSRARRELHHEAVEYEALLLFDSRQDLARAGTRGADTDTAVHLAYTSPVAEIVVDVRPAGDAVDLSGQVLTAEAGSSPVFEAAVLGPDQERTAIDGDDLGRFSMRGVARDVVAIRLTNGEIALRLRLDLRANQ